MANVRVAVRVRPLSKRETKEGGKIIVEVDDKVTKIRNLKVNSRPDHFGDSREKVVAFNFDYCYWSVNPEDPQYASQDVVFQDLGTEVLSGATKGYNICLFAYGQTGSGKTYTMLGTPASVGLTPRICEGLFSRKEAQALLPSSCRIKVSFLEIYNERVRDLLKQSDPKKSYTLRVREHPEMGPYVQGLSQHVVTNYKQVIRLLEEGIANRITAATHVHEASSRSHAIFTIHYSQATLQNNLPSEITSKINLVDLAGSEKADPSYCKNRMAEGANINKSLVALGIVISTLAQNSQMVSSCQSLHSTAGSDESGTPGFLPGPNSGGGPSRRQPYIPYRDSVLTWLLKDSLGGNSRTIMVATVSPAHTSYSETLSTLRYASNAKNIVNRPEVNEDANVKLIRELREEIGRLKALLLSCELRNFCWSRVGEDAGLKGLVLQNELKIDELIRDWTQKWRTWQALLEHCSVDVSKSRSGVAISSSLPHLMALEDDVLNTGVVLYHLKEGITKIGRSDSDQEQDIVLQGQWIERDHCTITSACGVVVLRPVQGARCTVNGRKVTASCRLTQGAVVTLGKAQRFRFNHPAEAAVLRQRRQVGEAFGNSSSLEWLDLDGNVAASFLGVGPLLWKERQVPQEQCDEDHPAPGDTEVGPRAQGQHQQCRWGALRQQIPAGHSRAEEELEFGQTCTSQQTEEGQQQLFRETCLQEWQQEDNCRTEKGPEVPPDTWLSTRPETPPSPLVQSRKRPVKQQLLWRRTLRATERNTWKKRISVQLASLKKQRLLEAQRRPEQPRTPECQLQDDSTCTSLCCVSSSGATAPGPPQSQWASCNSLSCQGLCIRHLPRSRSVFLDEDLFHMILPEPDPGHPVSEKTPSPGHVPQATTSPLRRRRPQKNGPCLSSQGWLCTAGGSRDPSAPGTCLMKSQRPVSIQEVETVGQQPSRMATQGVAPLCHSDHKLKPRDGPKTLTPAPQSRRTKGLANAGSTQTAWQERDLGLHRAAKGSGHSSPHPQGPKQVTGLGKASRTFLVESKPPFSKRAAKGHLKLPSTRVRDVSQKYSCLPRGRSLKRQYSSGDPDTTASCVEPSSVVGSAREKGSDTSDTDSNYSVDSLSSVCAEASLRKPPIPQDPPGVWGLPESGVSDSDNSQISEDSLAEKGYQSPKESLKALRPPSDHGHPRTRMRTSGRGVSMPSGRHMLSGAHRSLSSNHLTGAEEELGKEEPFLGSMDEMPAETFWHLQTPVLPIRPRPIIHGAGARLSAIPPVSSSPYLDPQLQPVSEWPESETEPSCPKGGLQLSRESPLVSTDSWFSCDSKVSPCSPSGIEGLSCPSPRVQEIQPCSQERSGNWPAVKDLKPSGMEAGLLCSLALPQDCAELSCNADVHTASVSDTSRLSLWGTARLLQPVADGNAQSRGSCNPTQQGSFGLSNSSESGVPIASVASFTYVDSTHERDWAALQRKYPCELSHSVLEDVGEPGPGFFFLGEDSSPLARDSSGGDTHLPDGHGVSRILDVSHTLVQLSKARCLRAEREQDSVNAKLENTKLVFSSSGREASCSGFSSADLASLASGSRSTQDCVIESKMANSVKAAHEVEQMSGEEGSGGPGVASSAQQVFQKSACHSRATSPTQADHRPQGWSPLRKNSVAQPEQLIPKSHPPQQEGRAGFQESSGETGVRNAGISFAFPSGPAVYLHSASWSPSPPPLQPPPLETVYVTKSRDALTETALEVPTCREVWVPSPPPREAWGLDHSHQDLPEASLKNSWPVPLQSQESQVASPQPVTAGKPVGLTGRDGPGHLQECSVSTQEESHDVLCFLSAQDRHFLSSNSTKIYKFESQVRILNNKHSFSALQQREKAAIGPCCSVSVDGSVCGKPCLFVCESEAEEKEGQAHTQACARGRQCPSRTRPDCICEATDGSLKRDMAEGNAASVMPRCGCDRVGSPTIKMQDKSLTYAWEGKTEARLLGEPPHLRDSPTRLTLSGTELTSGKVQLVTGCQERSPSECQGPRVPQDMFNSGEEIWGKKQNKRVNNADEMARLVKSVMQLENDILEIESKQNKWLHASPQPGDQKDQERADHVLRPGSPGNCLAFKDLPYSLGQTNDRLFQDSESGEKEADSITGKGLQAQKITSSPFRPGEHVEESQCLEECSSPSGLDRPPRDTWDTAHRESTSTCLHPHRWTALPGAPHLLPSLVRSEHGKPVRTSVNMEGWPLCLGNPGLETTKDCQESQAAEHGNCSRPQELGAQGRAEERAEQMGGSPQEENHVMSPTPNNPNPRQPCVCTNISQELVCPLLSQTDFSTAPFSRDLRDPLPLPAPSYLHASAAVGFSSVDYVLDPTVLKIPDNPLVHDVALKSQSRESRSCSLQGNTSGSSSMAHALWCGRGRPTALGFHGQSHALETIPPGNADRVTANASLLDPGEDLGITSMDSGTWGGFGSEAEAVVQEEVRGSSLNRAAQQLEERVGLPLEEDKDQGGETGLTVESRAEDQGAPCNASSPSVSPLREPESEPQLLATSAHASICLAILEEIRQAKVWRKRLSDFTAGGTDLPCCETSVEPACYAGAAVTGNEGEAPGCQVASLSAVPGHLSASERKGPATPTCAHSLIPWPSPEADRGPQRPSLQPSPVVPAVGERESPEELNHFQGLSEMFIVHSSSRITGEKKTVPKTPCCADPLASDKLLSLRAVEGDIRAASKETAAVSSPRALWNDPGLILCGQSQSATWDTGQAVSPGPPNSSTGHQEPKTLDTTYGGGSGHCSVTARSGNHPCYESLPVVCEAQSTSGFWEPEQVHAQCLEASAALEDMRESPEAHAGLPGAPRRVGLEDPGQQYVRCKGNAAAGLAESCGTGSENPRPIPSLNQSPSLNPGVAGEASGRGPKDITDGSVFPGGTSSSCCGEEESRAFPCEHLCSPRPDTARASPSRCSPLLCHRDGDLEKRNSKATPHSVHLPFTVPSRACEMGQTGETMDSHMSLACGRESRGIGLECGPVDSSPPEPSAAAVLLSPAPAGGCLSSLCDRTCSLAPSAAGGSSEIVGRPEEIEAASFPSAMHAKPLKSVKGHSVSGQNAQGSQNKLEPPATVQGPPTLGSSDTSVGNELLVEPQPGCQEDTIRCLSEKLPHCVEPRGQSCLDPPAKLAAHLKHTCCSQLDSAWEVDGQQRDQAPGGGKDSAPGGDPLPAGERVLNACQPGDAGREVAVTKPPRSRTSSPGFEDASSVPLAESTARRTGQPCHEGCQWDPYHRCSLPVTGIFSGPRHSLSSLRPQMVSSSPSRQELNTRVEAPPPTDEDTKGLSRPWSPSVWGCSSGKQAAAPRRDEDCREKALSSPGDGSVGPRLLAPPLPPDCTFSTLWCIPTPDVKISWESGTSAQAQQDKPPNLGIQVRPENGQVDKEVWYFDPSDNRPCIPPWCPEGPLHMGWRQCVFGGAADASCSQKAGGLMPSDVVQCSRMGDGLGDQDSPVHSHLTMSAQPRDLSGTQSSFKSGQGTPGAWKMWSSSFVSGDLHILRGPEEVDPALGPGKILLFKAQASASEASCPEGRARMTQGTQTIGCRRHWSCADVPSTQHDIVVMSPCDLASWTSMHSLSTHLSQLLHSTSELLESLSQPGVAKRDFLAEAPLALRTDGATQTTVDKGSQTELALSPLPLQDPEATPLEVAVVPEVLSTDLLATSQEKRDIAGTLQESQAKEPACKAADLREDSVQDPLMPSSRWRLQKAAWGQALSPASPPPSPSLLPTSAQPEESCMGVSPSFSLPPPLGLFPGASEPHLEPRGQRKLDHTSALLVDRASSPILTLSASTQAVGPPSTPFPKGHLKLDASPRPLPADELGSLPGAEAVGEEGQSASEGSRRKLSELSPPWSSQQSPQLQVSFLEQLQPEATTGDRSSSPPPPPKHRSQGTADSIVPEEEASPECGPLDSTGPSQWQSVPGSGGKGPASPVEPKPTLDPASLWTCSPQLIDTAGLQGSTVGPPQACQPQGVLCPPSLGCMASRPQLHSLRDLPMHNKFRNWCGVLDASPGGLAVNEEHRASLDLSSGEQPQRPPQPSVHGLDPAWYLRKQIPLQVGAPNPSLSVELTEAKLYRGFGEADALLQVLQNGTGEALAPDSPVMSTWEELYSRQKKAIETLRRERAERLQNSCWTGSLSPQKQLSLQPTREPPFCNLDLPSKRLEYLQCLRKEVVETTRSPRAAWSSIHPSPDPELMLRDCQRAREEAKVEMARARDLLQERTGREKLQIRRQITARLWQEEEKLHTLACHSSPCTSSHGSLSSGVTSGYNSSPALSSQLHSPESGGASSLPDSQDAWTGYRWSYSALRDNHLGVARATGKNSTNGCSLGSGCRAPSSPSPLGACFSSCYQDLAKHIVDTSVADVMAACSDNLHNLFCCQATAGWNYQGEEQQVQLYYKEFSSTRHGFLGAGVVPQPLSHVWAAVSDPTLWPLYHKPIQTARLQQRVTNSISLVYLVCDPTLCALKQPRDFCCVCVEAKEAPALPGVKGHLSVMAAQSVYDTSMPRPSRRMVRGEVLPSAWVLQPVTVEGREVTRVIYLAQVELGAPGFPPHLLSSFLRQQPLTVARLSSFLGS